MAMQLSVKDSQNRRMTSSHPELLSPEQKEPIVIQSQLELNFGLRWEFVGDDPIDLDASCVSFDVAGNPGEVVFFNNLQTTGEWMVHSGDNTTGEGDEDDEAIQVYFSKVPAEVAQMILVITCQNANQNLSIVKSVSCVVTNLVTGQLLCPEMDVALSKENSAIIVCSICRRASGTDWELRELMVPADGNSVGETRLLQKMQDQLSIPPELLRNRKKLVIEYDTKKGDVAQIPLDLQHIMMGLGWSREESDLDASAIMLDEHGCFRDYVSAKRKHMSNDEACTHSGDNAFDGQGDKENIHLKLDLVSPDTHFILFAVTHVAREHDVWNSGRLGATQGAYCRLAHITKKKNFGKGHTHNLDDRKELCRTNIMKLPRDASALIFAAVFRDPSRPGGWSIKKIGETLTTVLPGTALPGELLPTMRCLTYFLKDKFKDPEGAWVKGGWNDFRQLSMKKFMLQVTVIEARGITPQDADFQCHVQVWIMDRERHQRKKTGRSSDRVNPQWNEAFDFRVTVLDSIRIMLFEWGSVGVVDVPLAANLPDNPDDTLNERIQGGETVDRWFPLTGHNVGGEVRLKFAFSSSPLTDDDDDDGAVCCSIQ